MNAPKLLCSRLYPIRPRCLSLILVRATKVRDFATKSVNVDLYIPTSCIQHVSVLIASVQVGLKKVAPLGLAFVFSDLLTLLLCVSFLGEERLAKLRHLPSQVVIQIFRTLACLNLCLLIHTALLTFVFLPFNRYRLHRYCATMSLMT